ncbi:MAG: cache domain-containing protein [Candidatus Scalindua sp.]|nr:cache domain-containing protein [Candidatus Scalindua sp.]MDV5165893.1 cache domain-containing protein [Candidatus Scalindua sp.]
MSNTKRSLLIVCILSLALLSIFTARTANSDTFKIFREGIVRDLKGIAEKQAGVIREYVENEKQNIKVAAYDLHNYYAKSDYSKALEYLVSVQNIYHYKEIFVANTAGNIVLSTDIDHNSTDMFSSDAGATIFSRPYFKKAIDGETFVSDIAGSVIPIKNEDGQLELGMPTMLISTPILSADAQVLGVLVFRIDIEQINALMFHMTATKSGDVYLINQDGYMLTESRFTDALELVGHIEKRTALELRVENPETNSLTLAAKRCITRGGAKNSGYGYPDYRNRRVLGYWVWMEEYNWGVIVEIDLAEACQDIREYFQFTSIKNLRGFMRQQIGFIKDRMNKYKNNALSIAHKPQTFQYTKGVTSIDEYVTASGYLEFLRDEYNYKDIFICNAEGVVKLSTEKKMLGKDVSTEDYFVKAKDDNVFTTDIRPAKAFTENEAIKAKREVPTMLVSAKIKNSAVDFAGVVVLRINMEEFNEFMHGSEIGKSGEVYLVNKDGVLLTESRFAFWLKRKGMIKERTALELRGIVPETGELTKSIESCKSGEGYCKAEYKDYRGVLVLGTWDWMPEYEWGIIVEIDLEESFQKSSSFWGIKQYY